MILNLYILFLALSIAFIIIGYFAEWTPIQLTGFAFMFILGVTLMTGGLQYEGGEIEVYIYGDNFSDYHYDDYNGTTKYDDMQIFHTNKTIFYDDFDAEIISGIQINHFFGLFLSIASILGFINVLFDLGKFKKKMTEYDPEYDEKEN